MHNNTMKPMVGVAVELDGCLVLRPPPMLEFRMHAKLLLFCLLHLDISTGFSRRAQCRLEIIINDVDVWSNY